ncbi:epidermal retinol dehydrogenase 2-like [Asterias rubens]|uniref:epidermal retinol dehydrogenase 2-like n=1 Tax=Asterias rubens TaxID=7604 RepID=UPI001455A00F|nr:epidermal retinol dehydrogenase 2-like [Asterias rubens]
MSLQAVVFGLLRDLFLIVWYFLEAIVLSVIPRSLRRRKSVAGEIVLITGAGSGIGRLLAHKFSDLGATLVLWDVNETGNQETANQVRENGGTVHDYTVDISVSDNVYNAAEIVKRDVGDVTILVNNAGVVTGKMFLDCPDHLIKRTMDVNISAHFWTLKAFLPSMIAKNKGHIVNVASLAGLFGMKNLVDYCTSKFAAVGLHDALQYELVFSGKTGVKTTVVCPFFIDTGMFSGVKVKDPLMTLSLLKPSYVIRNIMDAVLLEEKMCILPRLITFAAYIKYLLPEKATLLVFRRLGFDVCMESFVGRGKKD